MDQMNLDNMKHCTTPFGAYVQANHESNPHNTNVLRTRDGIYLRPNNNFQGRYEVMDLNTRCVITCHKVTKIPVTNVVIKAIEAMAHKQGFKNLKFKNRHGVIFHDADWLAGVDYEDEDADEDEHKENTDKDEQYEDSEDQDIELEEATSIDPGEIDDIIEDEANPNEHQDDRDHQESEENTGIKELSREEPGVPSKSETYEPLDPPDNELDTGDVESGPSNLDEEQEEERREAVASSEREILFHHGSSREREPKHNLLSHRQHDCRLHDEATAGRRVSQVPSGNHGTTSKE